MAAIELRPVFSAPEGRIAVNDAFSVRGTASASGRRSRFPCGTPHPWVSARLSGRRLHFSHNPPLVTSLPSDDTIRRLSRLSTRIGHVARLSINHCAFTTSCRPQEFSGRAAIGKSGPIPVAVSAKRNVILRQRQQPCGSGILTTDSRHRRKSSKSRSKMVIPNGFVLRLAGSAPPGGKGGAGSGAIRSPAHREGRGRRCSRTSWRGRLSRPRPRSCGP